MTVSAPDPLESLPKIELHLHLEGSIRPPTASELAARRGQEHVSPAAFTDFDGFLRAFLAGLDLLQTADDFALATERLADELAAQSVMYAEVTTTPFNHHRRGVSMKAYAEGLNEGRRRARGKGIEIGWVLDIPRELEPPGEGFTAGFLLGNDAPDGVVGIGLGGPEPGYPAQLFVDSFARVRAAGLASLPHAGETTGAKSVWVALRDLGAHRIGHGVRSTDDPTLVDHLAATRVPLEISLTSNVCTGVVASSNDHPLPELVAAGVAVSINTDDPAYFFTTLSDELRLAQELAGWSTADVADLQASTLDQSFAPDDVRRRFREALGEWAETSNVGRAGRYAGQAELARSPLAEDDSCGEDRHDHRQ